MKIIYNFKLHILFFVLIFYSSASFAQGGEEAEFTLAKKAFGDGFYFLAQENLEEFLNKYPATNHLYEAHLLLGRCFYYQNNLKKSAYEFDIVLNAPPPGVFQEATLYWMGDVYYKRGDFKKALEFYQKIIEEYPASKYASYALYSKAWSYYKLGFLEDSSLIFNEVVSHYPLDKLAIESFFKAGECNYLIGRYDEAEKILRTFIEKYPLSEKVAESYYIIGEVKYRHSDYNDSINLFNRALSISPNARWSSVALFRTAEAYFQIKDYNESMKGFERCAKESSNYFIIANSLLGLIHNYEKKGMTDEALRICDTITTKFPRTDAAAEAYYLKAKILDDKNRLKEAEEASLKGIDKFLSSRQVGKIHYELGWIYLKEHRPKEALAEFNSAVKNMKDKILISSALCKIGDIYFDNGDYDKAMDNFGTMLKLYADSPWSDYAQYSVGNIFLNTAKYDQAILAYQSILVNFPRTKLRQKVTFNLAVAYFNKKDFERALAEFERLKNVSPQPDGEIYQLYLADSLYNVNRYPEALDIFKSLAKNAADKETANKARYQIGWCYYRMNKNSDAAVAFSSLAKDCPHFRLAGDALYQTAVILSEEGKTDAAIEKFKEFAAGFADSDLVKTAYRKIGGLKKQLKDTDSALEYFRKAVTDENNESNAHIQYEIAEILEGKGLLKEAAENYLKVTHFYSKGIFWAVRSEFKCAHIFEKLEDYGSAITLYEKLAAMDVEESAFAKKQLELLKAKLNR